MKPVTMNKATAIPPDYKRPTPDIAAIDFVPPEYKLTMAHGRHMYVIPPTKIEAPEVK
jgi:hypothetical protein